MKNVFSRLTFGWLSKLFRHSSAREVSNNGWIANNVFSRSVVNEALVHPQSDKVELPEDLVCRIISNAVCIVLNHMLNDVKSIHKS